MFFDGMFLRRMVSAAVVTGLLVSCSVKEERVDCPCFLTLDFGGVEAARMAGEGIERMDLLLWSDGALCDSAVFMLADGVKEYDVAVPKSTVEALAVCADGGSCSGEYGMVIGEGEACPSVYLFADSFAAEEENVRREVILRRNFCVLTVLMKTSYKVSPKRFYLTVTGSVNGFGRDGQPSEGPFLSGPEPSEGGIASVNLPRQSDDLAGDLSLRLEFQGSDDVRTFPVGEYILESGYDWHAPDLDDISVEVDFSKSGVTFTIDKWRKTLSFDMVI